MKQKQAKDSSLSPSPTNRDRGNKQKVKFDVVTPSVRDSIPTTNKTEQMDTLKVHAENKGDLMNETLRHRLAEDDDKSNNPNHSETDPTRAISAFRMKSPVQFIEVNDNINENSNDKDNSSDDEYIKQYVNSVGSPIQGDRDRKGEGQNVLISPNSPSQLKIMTSPSNKEIQTVEANTKEE